MLIRTQNRLEIMNINNVGAIAVYGEAKVVAYMTDNTSYQTLGEYSSREKAVKVLDDIQKYYERDISVFVMPKEEEV